MTLTVVVFSEFICYYRLGLVATNVHLESHTRRYLVYCSFPHGELADGIQGYLSSIETDRRVAIVHEFRQLIRRLCADSYEIGVDCLKEQLFSLSELLQALGLHKELVDLLLIPFNNPCNGNLGLARSSKGNNLLPRGRLVFLFEFYLFLDELFTGWW